MWKVPLFKLNYGIHESNAVNQVLKSQWMTMGEKTALLEANFENYLGNDSIAVAVSSCTAALHLSMLALNIQKGDEIIVPSLSFIAQINIIKNLGAIPILVDCVSEDNLNMDMSTIKCKITSKTRAIIVLHYAGYPCEINEDILNLCKKNNIKIIEDVAHAPGAEINNIKCGTIGDFGCFSFFSNKNIAVGEGGLIVVKDIAIANRLRLLRSHGMTSLSLDRIKGRAFDYDVIEYGLNYRIDEVRSAIAIEQLKKLDEANNLRKNKVELYKNNLQNIDVNIPFSSFDNLNTSVYHIFPILLPKGINRKKIMQSLQYKGVQSSIHYPAFWSFSKYKSIFESKSYPICKEISIRQLTLPLYPTMRDEDVNYVSDSLKEIINE